MFESETAGGRTHLVLVADDSAIDNVVWGMVTHNEIGRVIVPQRSALDGRTVFRYDITGLVPLTEMREHSGRRQTVLTLVDGLVDTLVEAEKFMIGVESFALTRDHVYIDPESFVPSVLCVPLRERVADDLAASLREFLLHLWYDRAEDRDYVGELVAVLPPSVPVDLGLVSRTLRNLEVGRGEPSPVVRTPQFHTGPPPGGLPTSHGVVAPPPRDRADHRSTDRFPSPEAPSPHVHRGEPGGSGDEKPMSLLYLLQHWTKENKELYEQQRRGRSETQPAVPQPVAPHVVAPQHGATPVGLPAAVVDHAAGALAVPQVIAENYAAGPVAAAPATPQGQPGGPSVVHAWLRRESSGEVIALDKQVMVLGRRRARVDIAIAGDTVSKNHALLYAEGAGWALTDNGSTNGTLVDGAPVERYVPVRLAAGSTIQIGDEVLTLIL